MPSVLRLLISLLCVCALYAGDRRTSFNEGWRFNLGEAAGAQAPAFNDAQWKALRLPHDWAIAGPFDSKLNPHTGALPIYGVGWYRKTFTLPATAKDRYFSIEFDGAMSNSTVWLNGVELGRRPYGYIGFAFDLTPHLKLGGEANVLAVRVNPEDRSSRWYPGAGIYRNVWLIETAAQHVARYGTYVTTPAVSDAEATVDVKTDLQNRATSPVDVVLLTTAWDPAGKKAAQSSEKATLPAGGTLKVATSLKVPRPQRWDIDTPRLYTLVTEVQAAGKTVDKHETPFGIRTIAFDKQKGFLLNGRVMKLQGVCLHHDLGALGAAVNRRATERQLQIMKAAGVNAIRTSHNPPSPEQLEFCDRLGLVVMDEAFDMWRIPKVPNGYSKYFPEWSERDVRDFARRDRNHPSVIMWSIGNEIGEQGRPNGWEEARRLSGFFRQEDPSRPTTAGFNNWEQAIRNKLADEVDIPGFNYKPMFYERILADHPNWIIVGAESASTVSSRGVYHLPIEKYEKHPSLQLTSYDVIVPMWATLPDTEFEAQDKLPQVLGEFVWTGFDYLGEPTPYHAGRNREAANDWPSRSSYFGMVDLAGFPKDRYYLYQSRWTTKPMVHVLPHWNWAGYEGKLIPVFVYTNGEEVELFLNGKSLGKKKRFGEPVTLPAGPNVSPDRKFVSKYRLQWEVPYEAGALKAVAYQGGKAAASMEVKTAGPAARIRLIPDRGVIQADGEDLAFITARIEDEQGNLVPGADNLIVFDVTGAGHREAVDNGNAASEEPFQAGQRKAFNGLALLIVRSEKGKAGFIRVNALAGSLAPARAEIRTRR